MKVDLYTQSGELKGQIELPKEIFEVKFNADLIHQALVRQHANARENIAHTKTKGDVSGGGRKPYRQKGTGRARQGSSRSPLWKGGGVTFGPRNNRNFEKLMPKKQRRQALFSALSEKARQNAVFCLESFETEKASTKVFNEMIKKLPIKTDALFVIPEKDGKITLSARNLKSAKTILPGYLNIEDLRKYEKLVFFKDAIEKLSSTFLK